MDAPENMGPSAAELMDIATHALQADVRTLQIPTELEAIAEILAPKWVRDFLFTQSPIHVQHLVSPSLQDSSLIWTTELTQVFTANHAPLSEVNVEKYHHSVGHHLFAPVFAAGSKTVGVGVFQGRLSSDYHIRLHSAKSGLMRHNFRFVYDFQHRILVRASDVFEDGTYIITSSKLVSPKLQKYTVAFLRRDTLQTIALTGETLRPQDLLPNLIMFQNGVYPHDCSACGQSASEECSCELTLSLPTQAHDNNAFFRAMAHHAMASTANIVGKEQSLKGIRPTVAGSRLLLQGVQNWDAFEALSAWSVWAFTSSLTESPRVSQALYDQIDFGTGHRWPHAWTERTNSRDNTPVFEIHPTGFAVDAEIEELAELPVLTVKSSSIQNRSKQHLVKGSVGTETVRPADISAATSNVRAAKFRPRRGASNKSQLEGQALSALEVREHSSREHSESSETGRSLTKPCTNCHKKKTNDLERRRELNRLAARRYHMRKRILRQEIATELKTAQSKVLVLKRRENNLRQENVLLRQTLGRSVLVPKSQ